MTTQSRRKVLAPEVRAAKERRLTELEQTAAIYGIDVPVHVKTEIEDLQAELELVDIIQRRVDPNVTDIVKRTDYGELLSKFIGDHARRLSSIELWQSTRDQKVIEDDKKRETRQIDLDARLQRIVILVTIAIAASAFNTLMFILYVAIAK